jgi:glycosyltransferase involved in cell wall biosynthesis
MSTNERRFSIIMTAYDQAYELKENLPVFLSQQYEPGYEVVVVDESSTDETADLLKLLKNDYPNLYTTFLPKSEGYALSKKQAYNIGVKAAKNDWLMFANANHPPMGDDVLQAISDSIDTTADLTLGYLTKKGIKLQAFVEVDDAKDHITRIERKLQKVRKRKRHHYRWGRYDFIVTRKQQAFDMLKYYELRPSFFARQAMRWRIFWKNLFSHYEYITYLLKEQ